MPEKEKVIEPLLEKVEQFGKTSFELLRLKSLDKTADIASALTSRLVWIIIFSLFVLALNIAVALWLGEMFGKSYYGFFAVAAFYGLASIILYLFHPQVKARVNDAIVRQFFN